MYVDVVVPFCAVTTVVSVLDPATSGSDALAAPEAVLAKAMELAERICANAPVAVRESKGVVYRSLDASLYLTDEAWAISDAAAARNRSSEDAAEGPRAFAEKRPPAWKGR